MPGEIRMGCGYDVHRLVCGRVLMLGGIEIPFELGLEGHSDADVLLHALTDAVLGALAWGDIGAWFPPSDPRFLNAASSALFEKVWNKAAEQGWRLINCDAVVVAERPKLAPFIESMRERIGELFGASPDRVSIKATTTEKLGFTGRGEGVATMATVLLER